MRSSLFIAQGLLALSISLSSASAQFVQATDAPFPPTSMDRGILPAQQALLTAMRGHALPADLLDHVEWIEGAPTRLGDLRGKVVVLQFWKVGNPSAQSWRQRVAFSQKRFGTDDLKVIAIHVRGDAEVVRAFVQRQRFKVATALDTDGALTTLFHAAERPVHVLIDRQGAVRYWGLNGRGIDDAIKKLLREKFDPDRPAPAVYDPDAATLVKNVARDSGAPNAAPNAASDAAPGAKQRVAGGVDGFPPYSNPVLSAIDFRGRHAPPLLVQTWLTGKPALAGKVLMVDFWATWCGPCIASIPKTNKLADHFRDSLVVVGLSSEGVGDIRAFLKKHEMHYSIATDPARRTQSALGVRGIPHVLIVSPDGIVRFQGYPSALTEDILAQIIQASAKLSG